MSVKIKGQKVQMKLDYFLDLMSTLESALKTEEANEWLRNARTKLITDVAELKNELRHQRVPDIQVIRDEGHTLYAEEILRIEGTEDRIVVTISAH